MKKINKKSIDCSSCKEQIVDTNEKKELVLELQKILENAEILREQIMSVAAYYDLSDAKQSYGDKFCIGLLNNIDWIIDLVGDETELRIQEILNSK